jgi:hypothetical protein
MKNVNNSQQSIFYKKNEGMIEAAKNQTPYTCKVNPRPVF